MKKCTKCGSPITEKSVIYWKCLECGKVFHVNLTKLKNLQVQKKEKPGQTLLKCPGCGHGMDNGSEKMAYKCASCGSVMSGNLEYFTAEETAPMTNMQNQTESIYCKHCGKEISKESEFCTYCGKSVKVTAVESCSACGMKLASGARFCSNCGKEIGVETEKNSKKTQRSAKKFSGKKIGIGLAAVVLLVIVGCASVKILPRFLITPKELMAVGDYEKAYHKAESEQKDDILIENLIITICKDIKEIMKDPSSFALRDVWYEADGERRIVLSVFGKNSFGGMTGQLYVYNFYEGEYIQFTSISDLDIEEYSEYDDLDESLEKLANNLAREQILEICEESNELSEHVLERINTLSQEGLFKEVELLEEVIQIYPSETDDDIVI